MDTTEMEKLRILTMWECGKTTAEIAKSINKSTRTVQRWLSLQKKEGNMRRKERGRRPRKTTPEEDAKIVQFVKENPDLTQKEILTICNINIYKGTLRRRLQEAKTGGLDLDLFKGKCKNGKAKRTKKCVKQEKTEPELEQKVQVETVEMAFDPMNNSTVDTKCLNFEHQGQQYSNDTSQYEDVTYVGHGGVPPGEDGLFVITETVQENQADNDVFSELITDATRMVKIEMAESSTTNTIIAAPATSEGESSVDETPMEKPQRKRIRKPKKAPSVKAENITLEVVDDDDDDDDENEVITIEIKEESDQKKTIGTRKRKMKSEIKEEDDESEAETAPRKKTRRTKSKTRKMDEGKGKPGRRKKGKDDRVDKKQRVKKEKVDWKKDGKDTTDIEKSKILIMAECGMSTSDIAKSLKKSRRTVQRWLSKHNKGLDMERKERGRRPRKTTSDEDARIVQFVKENPHLSRKEVLQYGNINLHKVTLKNRLNEAGIFFNSQGEKILDFSGNQNEQQHQLAETYSVSLNVTQNAINVTTPSAVNVTQHQNVHSTDTYNLIYSLDNQ